MTSNSRTFRQLRRRPTPTSLEQLRPLVAVFMSAAVSVALACRADAAIINPFARINQDAHATVTHGFTTSDESNDYGTTGLVPAPAGTTISPGTVTALADDGLGSTTSVTLTSRASFGSVNGFRMNGQLLASGLQTPVRSYNQRTSAGVYGTSHDEKAQFIYRFEVDQTTRLTAVAITVLAVGHNFVDLLGSVDDIRFVGGHVDTLSGPHTEVHERTIMIPLGHPFSHLSPISSMDLSPGEHTLSIESFAGVGGGSGIGAVFDFGLLFVLGGGSELDPVLPDNTLTSPWTFTDAFSGLWFDPELTGGYTFQMQSDSLFTNILALPSFLTDPVTISANGNVIGQFGAGQSVDFTGLAGGGVANFSITGINPEVDGDDPLAFPIQLAFNTPIADFSMSPIAGVAAVPEPASLLAWSAFALLSLGARAMNRRRT